MTDEDACLAVEMVEKPSSSYLIQQQQQQQQQQQLQQQQYIQQQKQSNNPAVTNTVQWVDSLDFPIFQDSNPEEEIK